MERHEAFTEQEWAELEALSDGASISDLRPSQHEYCESTVLGNGKAPAEYQEQVRRSQLAIGCMPTNSPYTEYNSRRDMDAVSDTSLTRLSLFHFTE